MDKAGVGWMVLVLGIMVFWANGDNYVAAPLIVEVARDFHLEISAAAQAITAYMLPFGLFTLLFGPLADRYGKARVINLAAWGTAIFCALGALASGLASLSVMRALSGAFASGILPVTMSLIGDSFGQDPKEMQNALGKVLGMMFLGGASGTAIGGALAYFGSWRIVYLVYGLAGIVIALIMWRSVEKRPGTIARVGFRAAYEEALVNTRLLKTVSIIFLNGFAVFGSFSYAGKFVEVRTGYNILWVGLMLTCFGLATILGGRKAGSWRQKHGNRLMLWAGTLAGVAWAFMGAWNSPLLICLSLAGLGLGFIIIQSTLLTTAQQLMPQRRGTVMSLASFNMFMGGGLGTLVNGQILNWLGFPAVFLLAAGLILLAGVIGSRVLDRISPAAPSAAS
ncbi:MAG: MFS transporter [Desulfobaccales bacterium]